MTCGSGPPCWTAGCSEAEGARNGAVVRFLRGGFGADVVASTGEPLRASYPAALTGVEVVHTCRVEMELGLHLKTDVILSLFVSYSRVLFVKQY
jgi:hypothetical protein